MLRLLNKFVALVHTGWMCNPASSLISELNKGKTLLHAGPPMRWQEMTGPMKGACVGACLFEGWAKDEAQALAILEQGK